MVILAHGLKQPILANASEGVCRHRREKHQCYQDVLFHGSRSILNSRRRFIEGADLQWNALTIP
jgi:hypothetical protein